MGHPVYEIIDLILLFFFMQCIFLFCMLSIPSQGKSERILLSLWQQSTLKVTCSLSRIKKETRTEIRLNSKLRLGTKNGNSFPFCSAWRRRNGSSKLYVATLRAGMTHLEMRSETEGIFLFVSVALMELLDYSVMRRRSFITKNRVSHQQDAQDVRSHRKLFGVENFFAATIYHWLPFFTPFHTIARSLVASDMLIPSNHLNIKACRANALTFLIGFSSR